MADIVPIYISATTCSFLSKNLKFLKRMTCDEGNLIGTAM